MEVGIEVIGPKYNLKVLLGPHSNIFQAEISGMNRCVVKNLEIEIRSVTISVFNRVTLQWIPNHKGIEGNEMAAKEAVKRTFIKPVMVCKRDTSN